MSPRCMTVPLKWRRSPAQQVPQVKLTQQQPGVLITLKKKNRETTKKTCLQRNKRRKTKTTTMEGRKNTLLFHPLPPPRSSSCRIRVPNSVSWQRSSPSMARLKRDGNGGRGFLLPAVKPAKKATKTTKKAPKRILQPRLRQFQPGCKGVIWMLGALKV